MILDGPSGEECYHRGIWPRGQHYSHAYDRPLARELKLAEEGE
jgi:hypothetical protein